MKKIRQHSAAKQLWPNRGRHNAFPLLGLGGKGCSCCVHSADVDEVKLPSPLLAEAQSIDLLSAPLFCWGRKMGSRRRQLLRAPITLNLSHLYNRGK